ncbi:MAG: protein kinase [Anaerolineae bacterium]|nr:protein kinase [Anaerolineae bacterium]
MAEVIRTNTILNGRYLVQRKLGQGGMGAVYLAEDTRSRRPVAIKVARLVGPNDRAQFRREASYLRKLHHHGLPRVWDIFSDTQNDFLVMEYIPGDDLETLVQSKGSQPEWLVLRWADELLDSLEYLHSQDPPIIHRDIKPGNLKLRQDETLVLVDFGIAKEFVPGMDTFAGATAVTPGYSPLEQYSGANTDARSDLYAVGATLYFLLSGQPPPPAPDRATGDARLVSLLEVAPKTTPATDMLVRRAMSISRDQRWASAAEMRHAADAAARQLNARQGTLSGATAVATRSTAVAAPASQPARRKNGRVALLALAAIAVLAVILFTTARRRPPDTTANPTAFPVAAASNDTETPTNTATFTPVGLSPTLTPATVVNPTGTSIPVAVTVVAPPTLITVTQIVSGPTGLVTVTAVIGPIDFDAGVPPTSTPIGTFTPTPTATVVPRSPTPFSTSAPSATSIPTSSPTAPSSSVVVSLIRPNDGDSSSNAMTFEWDITSGSLAPDQAFEWRVWKAGQDPIRDGLGLAGITRSPRQAVNLAAADAAGLIEPGEYQWGVVLVETTPSYRPLRLISDTRTFRYERAGGGGGSTEPTLPPRP